MPTDRRLVVVALVVCLAGLVLAGRLLLPAHGGDAGSIPPPASSVPAFQAPASGGGSDGGPVLVHVVGAVRRPGVYQLGAGSRVRDAVRRAGGARRGARLQQINLAERLADGEQVVVPGRGVSVPTAAAGTPGAIVHLNSATAAQLDELDGIGPALAARIVAYRQQHGGFHSVDELGDVPGIGPVKLEALHGHIAV